MSEALSIADTWLDLHRIELQVYTDNERGVRLYERCGFEIEGTLKEYAFRDGDTWTCSLWPDCGEIKSAE